MNRREFVKASVAAAGTLGFAAAVKAGTRGEKTLIGRLAPKEKPSLVSVLQAALDAEREAVHRYTAALGSGLLKGRAKELSGLFKTNHEEHVELLAKAIRSVGGSAQTEKNKTDVAFATPAEIARFAYALEKERANALLEAVGNLENPELKVIAGKMLADEVFHAAAWYQIVGHHSEVSGFQTLPDKV